MPARAWLVAADPLRGSGLEVVCRAAWAVVGLGGGGAAMRLKRRALGRYSRPLLSLRGYRVRSLLIAFGAILFLTACGPTQEELLLTQIPITQTAEWSEKDQHADCLFSVLDDAALLNEASSACTSFECQRDIASQLDKLAEELPRKCPMPDPCARSVHVALEKLIHNMANYVHGPGPGLDQYQREIAMDQLFDEVRFSHEAFLDTLNSSCLRRNLSSPDY